MNSLLKNANSFSKTFLLCSNILILGHSGFFIPSNTFTITRQPYANKILSARYYTYN